MIYIYNALYKGPLIRVSISLTFIIQHFWTLNNIINMVTNTDFYKSCHKYWTQLLALSIINLDLALGRGHFGVED